jgi:hypothetical protein
MGTIRAEVRDQHLAFYPEEEELLKPFLDGFFVTWARRRRAYNTELSVYFLNPEPFMKEAYGFSQEILLVYSHYDRMEPRTIQAAEQFINTEPAKVSPARLFEGQLARLNGARGKRKEALAGLLRREEPSTDLPFEVTDDALEVGLVEDGLLLGSAE